MNTALLHDDVRAHLESHLHDNPVNLILKGSPFKNISAQELAQQLIGLQKSHSKLPSWFSTKDILFPPKINLEQTSSEITATYKASLVKGNHLIDITGGFGVDCWAFSQRFKTVTHCERHPDLSALVRHNAIAFGLHNLNCVTDDGITVITAHKEPIDVIYVDPSRRDATGEKVFKLSDCEPNVPEHLDSLLSKCNLVLMKTSPLLDITAGLRELHHVVEIHIVAVNNDVKELLWFLTTETPVEDITIKTINFKGNKSQTFETSLHTESASQATYSLPKAYLYEPNAAIMKSGCFASLSHTLNLDKLEQNSHLYTSDALVDFPGRRFAIKELLHFHKATLKKRFKRTQANITTRNFPWTVIKLKQQLQINDGGTLYLFFTTLSDGDKVCLLCEKTS